MPNIVEKIFASLQIKNKLSPKINSQEPKSSHYILADILDKASLCLYSEPTEYSNSSAYRYFFYLFVCLCWGLTSQSTIFQSCRDGATASWVINQYFRGVKCLAQGHNMAAVGIEPPTSRSGVRHSTTEPPRSPILFLESQMIASYWFCFSLIFVWLFIAVAMSFMIESDTGSKSIIDSQCIIELKHVRSWA